MGNNKVVAKSGRVGIKTSAVTGALTDNGDINNIGNSDSIYLQSGDADVTGITDFVGRIDGSRTNYSVPTTSAVANYTGGGGASPGGSDGAVQFNDAGSFAGNASVLYVNESTGKVGVGTTSPSSKLDVAGNVDVQGNVSMNYHQVKDLKKPSDPADATTKEYVDKRGFTRIVYEEGTALTNGDTWVDDRAATIAKDCAARKGTVHGAHNTDGSKTDYFASGRNQLGPAELNWHGLGVDFIWHEGGSNGNKVRWKPQDQGTSEIKSGSDFSHDNSSAHLWIWCEYPQPVTRDIGPGDKSTGAEAVQIEQDGSLQYGTPSTTWRIDMKVSIPSWTNTDTVQVEYSANYGCLDWNMEAIEGTLTVTSGGTNTFWDSDAFEKDVYCDDQWKELDSVTLQADATQGSGSDSCIVSDPFASDPTCW